MMSAYFEDHAVRDWPEARLDFVSFRDAPGRAFSFGLESDYIVFFQSREPLATDCLDHWTSRFRDGTLAVSQLFETLATIDLPRDRTAIVFKKKGC